MNDPFRETRWTLVLASRGGTPSACAALSELCAAYYAPVVAFIRDQVQDEDTARDLAHDFFARLLEKNDLNGAAPHLGKFRSYLLGAVKHFLSNARDYQRAGKRFGQHISLDQTTNATGSPLASLADVLAVAPDQSFDRRWACTVLDRALLSLAEEFTDKPKHFETLKPWLTGDDLETSQSAAGATLGMSEGAVKVAIHRLRQRFRAAVRAEVAHTVGDHSSVEDEMNCLVRALT